MLIFLSPIEIQDIYFFFLVICYKFKCLKVQKILFISINIVVVFFILSDYINFVMK